MGTERYHYIDNGRALASILGFFYHTALVFTHSWAINIYPISSIFALQFYTEYLNMFRMPLFLLISGFFTSLSLSKYPMKEFIKQRMMRLGIPFLSTFLTIGLISSIIILLSKGDLTFSSIIGILNPFSNSFTLRHLWFLYYILLFSIFMIPLKTKNFNILSNYKGLKFDKVPQIYFILISYLILFTVSVILLILQKVIDIQWPLLSTSTIAGSLPFFLTGVIIQRNYNLLSKYLFDLHIRETIFLGLLSFLIYITSTQYQLGKIEILLDIVQKIILLNIVMVLLYKFGNKTNRVLKYFSDASYPIYLLHQPIIIILTYIFKKYGLVDNSILSYLLILCSSIILTYLLEYALVKTNTVTRFMFTGQLIKPSSRNKITTLVSDNRDSAN